MVEANYLEKELDNCNSQVNLLTSLDSVSEKIIDKQSEVITNKNTQLLEASNLIKSEQKENKRLKRKLLFTQIVGFAALIAQQVFILKLN